MNFEFNHNKRGFTLIESLVALAVFIIIITSFYATFANGTRIMSDSKNRLGAISLANQKMEIIRNTRYENIGTEGGVPNGAIDPDYYEIASGANFHVKTDIFYIDDPYDGTIDDSSDSIPQDYKSVKITVSWGEEGDNQRVSLVSNFVPYGVETDSGGGTLRINIIDTPANGLANASVNISSVDNGINISTFTDSSGSLLRPGMPAGDDYVITVSKSDYETVTTLPISPESNYDPVIDQNATIIGGQLNIKSIIINLLSDIKITAQDPYGNSIENIKFDLSGGRLIGIDVSDPSNPVPAYNYNQSDLEINSSDGVEILDVSPGEYKFTLSDESAGDYEFFKLVPNNSSKSDELVLDLGVSQEVGTVLLDKTVNSAFVSVSELEGGTVVSGAEVILRNDLLGIEETLLTDEFGQVFFPQDEASPLPIADYELEINMVGFETNLQTVNISGLQSIGVVLSEI